MDEKLNARMQIMEIALAKLAEGWTVEEIRKAFLEAAWEVGIIPEGEEPF